MNFTFFTVENFFFQNFEINRHNYLSVFFFTFYSVVEMGIAVDNGGQKGQELPV